MYEPGLILAAVAAVASFLTAWWVMRRARRLGLVQAPNARSSHAVPTPTGGGLGIAVGGTIAGLLGVLLLPLLAVPVIMASVLIAFIGYTDDRRPLPIRWRLGAQVLLMGAVVAVLPLEVVVGLTGLPESVVMVVLTLCGALWINLFNFMDGIDGLAASEAIFLLLGAAVLATLLEPAVVGDPRLWWMVGVAAACLGFLLLNWPPARLFMGDIGSTYLGLLTAFFALTTMTSQWLSLWQWLILAALFLADILNTPVDRPNILETTALGAAWLAGYKAGVWPDQQGFARQWSLDRQFAPRMDEATRKRKLKGWRDAVRRTLTTG
jgi:Fuc2NAc and GlcNAc transferase